MCEWYGMGRVEVAILSLEGLLAIVDVDGKDSKVTLPNASRFFVISVIDFTAVSSSLSYPVEGKIVPGEMGRRCFW